MKPLFAAVALMLALTGCSRESACERYERYERTGVADDLNNQNSTPEELREAAEAQAECIAENG